MISSAQNHLYKRFVALEKARNRKKEGLFLVEGLREIFLALQGGFEIEHLIYNAKAIGNAEFEKILNSKPRLRTEEFSESLFQKLTYRSGVANALAMVKSKEAKQILPPSPNLVVVLESIEKPGNLGAIFRTCDAAGVDLIILAEPLTDLYNPNVIRSSLGSIFTNRIVQLSNEQTLEYLRNNELKIYTTWLEGVTPHFNVDMSVPCALVLGSEAQGVTDHWVNSSDECIKIPMKGEVDSMNVSTATAVIVYEAIRQKSV